MHSATSSQEIRCCQYITNRVGVYTPVGLDAWLAVMRGTRSHASSSFVLPPMAYKQGLLLTDRPLSWVAEVDGGPVAAAGLWRIRGGYEGWFLAGAAARPHMTPLALSMRRVFLDAWARLDYPMVIVHVRIGHRPGERLAALMGFENSGKRAGGMNLWEI